MTLTSTVSITVGASSGFAVDIAVIVAATVAVSWVFRGQLGVFVRPAVAVSGSNAKEESKADGSGCGSAPTGAGPATPLAVVFLHTRAVGVICSNHLRIRGIGG